MNEADLQKIREALEQPTLAEACKAMDKVLAELGYAPPLQGGEWRVMLPATVVDGFYVRRG